MQFVNERFKIKEKLFAFPFSDKGVDKNFFKKVYEDKMVDITFGTSGFDRSRSFFNHQQRISFEEDFSANEILFIHMLFSSIRSFGRFSN
jgi:hypothetical protein